MATSNTKRTTASVRSTDGENEYMPAAWTPDAVQRLALAQQESIQHDDGAILDFPIPSMRLRTAPDPSISGRRRKPPASGIRTASAKTRLRMSRAALATARRDLVTETGRRRSVEAEIAGLKRDLERSGRSKTRHHTRMASIVRQLLCAIEDERRIIGRSLHDGVAQCLSRILIRIDRMGKTFGAGSKELRDDICAITRALALAAAAVHRQAKTLWSSMLDDLGLVPSLSSYLDGFSSDSGIRTSFRPGRTARLLDSQQRMAMFRTVQDACMDAARRPATRSVHVSMRTTGRDIRLEIRDGGTGRPPGMTSVMRERLRLVGGRLQVSSAKGRTGSITAMIPIRLLGTAGEGASSTQARMRRQRARPGQRDAG